MLDIKVTYCFVQLKLNINKSELILRKRFVMTITDISEILEFKLNKTSRIPAVLVTFK